LGLPLVLMAVLTVAHLLFTSVRRRRRDLAVLRAIGFTATQVRSTVSWMAIALVAVALAIGLPVGIILGRLAWRLFGEQLGIAPVTVVPVASVAVLAVAGLVLAWVIAVVPGAAAGRARPGDALRAG
jgi:putative ABC transport system permease protein